MKKLPHGIISIILAGIAIFIGTIALFYENYRLALVYILCLVSGFFIISYSYCTKCQGRTKCAHVVFGKITKLFPVRKQSNYSFLDYLGVVIPILFIVVFPQMYLLKNIWMFIAFWILLIVAILEINRFVCIVCTNSKCLLCKNECIKNKID